MRLRNVSRFHRARDVKEAVGLLREYDGRAALVAGGVDLARSPRRDIVALIDLMGVGLSGVRANDGRVGIGTTTTLAEILESSEIGGCAGGVLHRALERFSVAPLRNMATLGGAVASGHAWSDIPTVLLALGAEVCWEGEDEQRVLLEDFYRSSFRGTLRRAVLTEIGVPSWDGAFAFHKLTRSATDIAILNAACGLGIQGGRVTWARVVVGATPYRAERLEAVERCVAGEAPGQELWALAQREVEQHVRVADDSRAGAAWRRKTAGVIVARALAEAETMAGREL